MQLDAYKYIKRPIQPKKLTRTGTLFRFFLLSPLTLSVCRSVLIYFFFHMKCARRKQKLYMYSNVVSEEGDKTTWNWCSITFGSVVSTSHRENKRSCSFIYFIHYRLNVRRCRCCLPLYMCVSYEWMWLACLWAEKKMMNKKKRCRYVRDSYELMTMKSMGGKS